MNKRIKKIFNKSSQELDAILIKNSSEPFIDKNFFYVTGLEQGIFEDCLVIIFPDGNADLIVSELEFEIAKKAKLNTFVYKKKKEIFQLIKKSLGSSKRIGLNFEGLASSDFKEIKKNLSGKEIVDASYTFSKTRMTKDKDEIEKIRKAARIATKVMEKIPNIIHKVMYEYELAAEINYLLQREGAHKPAFDTISSFGKNSAKPHYSYGKAKLNKGNLVLCDFGACYKYYNSDITRTFVFEKASEKHKKMHKIVKEAQELGFEKIKPGIEARSVHNAVYSFINRSEFKGHFIHNTGHSLGLSVHDGGVGFDPDSKVVLEENMVLTVEPGLYLPNFGGVRIEDDVLIKRNGIEILTKFSRDLIEL